MKLSIMQPYFLPYIGYFQLINASDKFVIYDNIEYTKKGWINRNRYLQNGKDAYFTIPIKKDSDYLDVKDRLISEDFNRNKFLNKIGSAYKKAHYYEDAYSLFEEIVLFQDNNLFNFIYNSILIICKYLDIDTEIIISSSVDIDHSLKSNEKVLSLCKANRADHYINPIGGVELYSKDIFKNNDIKLSFLKSELYSYKQFKNDFIPWLSILDVMMFNSVHEIKGILNRYKLI